jgi:hypothetical protein
MQVKDLAAFHILLQFHYQLHQLHFDAEELLLIRLKLEDHSECNSQYHHHHKDFIESDQG